MATGNKLSLHRSGEVFATARHERSPDREHAATKKIRLADGGSMGGSMGGIMGGSSSVGAASPVAAAHAHDSGLVRIPTLADAVQRERPASTASSLRLSLSRAGGAADLRLSAASAGSGSTDGRADSHVDGMYDLSAARCGAGRYN